MNIYQVGNFDWHDAESARQHLQAIMIAKWIFRVAWVCLTVLTILVIVNAL